MIHISKCATIFFALALAFIGCGGGGSDAIVTGDDVPV